MNRRQFLTLAVVGAAALGIGEFPDATAPTEPTPEWFERGSILTIYGTHDLRSFSRGLLAGMRTYEMPEADSPGAAYQEVQRALKLGTLCRAGRADAVVTDLQPWINLYRPHQLGLTKIRVGQLERGGSPMQVLLVRGTSLPIEFMYHSTTVLFVTDDAGGYVVAKNRNGPKLQPGQIVLTSAVKNQALVKAENPFRRLPCPYPTDFGDFTTRVRLLG